MKNLLIIVSILFLSSPVIGQSGKPQTIIIPTGSLGDISEVRKKMLEKTLESKLDDYFAIVPKELFEEAQEQAFQEMDSDECTEDQCILMIKEILQIENAFKMDLIVDEGDTQISITWNDQDQKRVEEDYCEGCKTKELRLMIGGLVEKLVGKRVIEKPMVVVEKSTKGVLYERKVNGKWGWHEKGDEEKDGKYVGEIKNRRPNGQGTLTLPNGYMFIGEWTDGENNGLGTETWSDGKKYVGEFKESKRHGQGTMIGSFDRDKYVGEYKDGEKNGQGIKTWSNGNKYDGEWKNGAPNGQGTMTFPNGLRFVGEWKEKPWNVKVYDKDGNIRGRFVNGLKQ